PHPPGASQPRSSATFVTTQNSTPVEPPQADISEEQVNWGFLAETAVLKRLGDFCRVERD
ncbi:MAG: hypothetical protein R3264_00170, partial [Anaerolineae bacterium]|nr:hypothetical protein [Anaerolineae bacterium]